MPVQQETAVLFADIRDFTSYTASAGDAQAYDLAQTFAGLVRDAVEGVEGRIVKTYGDGVMAAFSEPEASVRAAVEVTRTLGQRNDEHPGEAIAAGIGIGCGAAIAHEGDVFGHTVNLAKRLADHARAGQIVVCPKTREGSHEVEGIRYLDLGELMLKGLPPQQAFEAAWREELARMTARDDGLVLILTSSKLVVELSKATQAKLAQVTEELERQAQEGGFTGFLLRRLGSRIPGWIDRAMAAGGIGLEHDVDDVDFLLEGERVVVRTSPGRRAITLDRDDFDPQEARLFLERLREVRGGASP